MTVSFKLVNAALRRIVRGSCRAGHAALVGRPEIGVLLRHAELLNI